MSEVENKPVVDPVEPTVADAAVEPLAPTTDAAVVEEAAKTETEQPSTEAAAAVVPAEDVKEEKSVEPITEGQLAYKGPGLVKSLIPSKKEFWLSDSAVAPENLNLFLRGEKPEVAHSVVAWASQTGKSLLFGSKKNADRAHPTDVFALYDATDLKKQSPHEFSFKLNGHNHTFKAANDAERDGWYISIEKAIELGKASKEEITSSEAYKSETEKLSKPAVVAGAAAATKEEPEATADKKTRTKSPFARFSRKKEEDKEVEKEAEKTEETPVLESTETAPVAEAAAVATIPAAADATVEKTEPAVVEEKQSKPSKRGSIFGKLMSPNKEKSAKEAELKPEAPVSDNAPQLPETTTAETEAVPAIEQPAAETTDAPKETAETTTASPTKEKSNFLSGLNFMKRNRSVSPSAKVEESKVEEPVAEPAKVEEETQEPVKAEEPVVAPTTTETPAAKEETTTANKRQSVLGSLGRRASKALNRMQAPKKENAAPASEEVKPEASESKVEENPVVNGDAPEVKPEEKTIGDVVPEAVAVGQTQPVAASA